MSNGATKTTLLQRCQNEGRPFRFAIGTRWRILLHVAAPLATQGPPGHGLENGFGVLLAVVHARALLGKQNDEMGVTPSRVVPFPQWKGDPQLITTVPCQLLGVIRLLFMQCHVGMTKTEPTFNLPTQDLAWSLNEGTPKNACLPFFPKFPLSFKVDTQVRTPAWWQGHLLRHQLHIANAHVVLRGTVPSGLSVLRAAFHTRGSRLSLTYLFITHQA